MKKITILVLTSLLMSGCSSPTILASTVQSADYQKGLEAYNEGNFKISYAKFSSLAGQGNASAQYNLGVMYANGKGVTKDDKQAVNWYRKAAEQGYAFAQYNLGVMYANGKGVTKDDKQAVNWYRKAAEQGYAFAQGTLGVMYENGQGVTKNYKQALEFYKKSNTKWSKKKYAVLKKRSELSDCTTKLFGLSIKCANRDSLMVAIKKAGATVKLEDKQKWGDLYNSKSLLKGSSELAVDYTVDDYFAKATYTFSSYMDKNQVTNVRSFVSAKYGEPDYSDGKVSLGNVTYKWYLEDGIELKVSRGWPNTTTYLSFIYPENYQAMLNEQEKQKKAREAKQYKSQSNAF
ncbi:hypothetical protein GNP61_08070 [Aliivibrio fischeri]|uniref:tetratricopeptide repeat protein n=1 Tax=Aliivibrio fischeri TaxID=668 RepID=UPI0012DA474A|nr:tetratricopeptide repeat protein [Aliivibrio fischeri]MUK41517.1 hypothetical protein [Aliivibrio fischeri]